MGEDVGPGGSSGSVGDAQGVGSSCWDMISSMEESPPVIKMDC